MKSAFVALYAEIFTWVRLYSRGEPFGRLKWLQQPVGLRHNANQCSKWVWNACQFVCWNVENDRSGLSDRIGWHRPAERKQSVQVVEIHLGKNFNANFNVHRGYRQNDRLCVLTGIHMQCYLSIVFLSFLSVLVSLAPYSCC